MSNRKIILTVFILVSLVQLYFPAKMIWDKEEVLITGTEYKFKTLPIDPNDPFRGKYITLSFEENTAPISNAQEWEIGETIYVFLTAGDDGFAKIESVSKMKPTANQDYIKAKVRTVTGNDAEKLIFDYPFGRYYMEESKAYNAELIYEQTRPDTTKITYALVRIKNGDAVLKDVLIDGVSIREMVNGFERAHIE